MRTTWGDLPVSDAHIHFFSHAFFSILATQKQGLTLDTLEQTLGWQMPAQDPVQLAAQWDAELASYGIHTAAIMASLPGDEHSVASAVAAFPQRFHGMFMVNPLSQGAQESILAALRLSHLRVPCLFPAMHRYSLHDHAVTQLLEKLAATPDPVLFVHCGVLSVGVRKKLGLPSPFDLRFSNPIDVHALALRYPTIRFILPHFGAGYFREALMVADLCPNVHLDTSSSNAWVKYESGLTLAGVFRRALDVVGPTRLLFGTDSSFFPRGWNRAVFDAQHAALTEIGINATDAATIFSGNVERLLSHQP